MLTKAAAGQVRAVPAQGATSTETTWTVTISPFSSGSQKKAEPGIALKQFHQCWGDRVQHWLGNTAPVTPKSSSLPPTLKCWPKATLQNRACYFPQLKLSCTTRSVLPPSLLLPLGQKEARGLSPYCLDKHLHFRGNDLLSPSLHPWVQDSQHRRMDLPWKVTSPLTHQTGLGHRTAQCGEEETFSIPISSGQGEHLDQKLIFSSGQYMPAFQEDRWSSDSSGMMELLWQQEDDARCVSTILLVMPISLVVRNTVSEK